jgi:1-deoxy-D-xylulose-5-phosphate synthase
MRAINTTPFVITVEESTLNGGFGSAVLELANDARLRTEHIRRLGIPDRFIEHGSRDELLADLGLDVAGLMKAAREMAGTSTATHRS